MSIFTILVQTPFAHLRCLFGTPHLELRVQFVIVHKIEFCNSPKNGFAYENRRLL